MLGTGVVGRALAAKLDGLGHEVVIGHADFNFHIAHA